MSRPVRVVFDLDDTLYPEREFALSGFRAAAGWAERRWGVKGLAAHMARLLDEGHLGALFRLALTAHVPHATDADLASFVAVYREHEPQIGLFDDAAYALRAAAALGPIGLITDGNPRTQENKVRALGIETHFASIVYTGALGGRAFHKPHPKAYELTEAALAAPAAHFVYVGDNPAKDFVTPNARGWSSVQVVRDGGIHDAHAVADAGAPQHRLGSLRGLAALLTELARQPVDSGR